MSKLKNTQYWERKIIMKKVVVLSVIALSFATGFTCSKKAPEQAGQPAPEAAAQTEMAAPAEGTAAPAAPAPAPGTETK